MAQQFRHRPVVIEAMQYDGTFDCAMEIAEWARVGRQTLVIEIEGGTAVSVQTLEGMMRVSPYDWIIRGIADEFYPCKPDLFAELYEPVEED